MGCFRDALGIRRVRESEGVWGRPLGTLGNIFARKRTSRTDDQELGRPQWSLFWGRRGNILGTFVLKTARISRDQPVAGLAGKFLGSFKKESDLAIFDFRRKSPCFGFLIWGFGVRVTVGPLFIQLLTVTPVSDFSPGTFFGYACH